MAAFLLLVVLVLVLDLPSLFEDEEENEDDYEFNNTCFRPETHCRPPCAALY
jgi:hypothetical protein